MRIADVKLTFPAILVALLINGIAQTLFKGPRRQRILDSGLVDRLSFWCNTRATVRGMTLVEKNKEYVQAAR